MYDASVARVFQTRSHPWQASDAGMVSAAVFPFIYCHLLDIYLYSFAQNTNWLNCYNHHKTLLFDIRPSMIISGSKALSREPQTTTCRYTPCHKLIYLLYSVYVVLCTLQRRTSKYLQHLISINNRTTIKILYSILFYPFFKAITPLLSLQLQF